MNDTCKWFFAGVMLSLVLSFSTAKAEEVGKFKLPAIFLADSVVIDAFDDPKVGGVTCHIAHISKRMSWTDPSNTSIACRQVGPIKLGQINTSKEGEIVFSAKKSPFFKKMIVRRIYDQRRQVLIYISHTTKAFEGSYKVSISSVSLNSLFGSSK